MRLLWDAHQIAKGGEPVVWKEPGEERTLLMAIRTGEMPQGQIEAHARLVLAEIDGMKPWKLPEDGDEKFLEDWLLRLRLEDLEKEKQREEINKRITGSDY